MRDDTQNVQNPDIASTEAPATEWRFPSPNRPSLEGYRWLRVWPHGLFRSPDTHSYARIEIYATETEARQALAGRETVVEREPGYTEGPLEWAQITNAERDWTWSNVRFPERTIAERVIHAVCGQFDATGTCHTRNLADLARRYAAADWEAAGSETFRFVDGTSLTLTEETRGSWGTGWGTYSATTTTEG